MEKFSVKKPFTILVAVIMVLLLGFVSITNLQTNLLPDISTPYLMVVTVYPGASPERVESEVSDVMPGFSKEDLWTCYPEFVRFEPGCRFIGCSHIGEPDCGVKTALAEGKISQVRYDNYVQLYQEMKNMRKY